MKQNLASSKTPSRVVKPRVTDSLREFIELLEQAGELTRVRPEVDPVLEITEITDRVSKRNGPALLFEKVRGSSLPVAINLFGTERRMALALGVDDVEEIRARLAEWLSPPLGAPSLLEKLSLLPKLAEAAQFFPKRVASGACQERVETERPNLSDLPILQCWPKDAGRFITLPLVITKDLETGARNVGVYRMQVLDDRTTAMHWQIQKGGRHHFLKYEKAGRPMEVAVALGGDPAAVFSAVAPLPPGIDEFLFAGFLRRKPVELVKCKTIDLEVPASAEIILEGTVDPKERTTEGPFGDHTGYYSLEDSFPVFRIQAVTRRRDALYPTTIVGRPPMEDYAMGWAAARIFLPVMQKLLPEIVDIHLPPEGVFHNCCLVSIRKTHPGQARKVICGLLGLGQMASTKLIVVFDEDVNVQDPSEAAWRALNNVDPRRDLMLLDGPVDDLDHSSPTANFGSKLGVDATKKWKEEGHPRPWPPDIVMDEATRKRVEERWNEYGL